MVSWDEYKFLILIKSILIKSIFSCTVSIICVPDKKYLPTLQVTKIFSMSSTQHFSFSFYVEVFFVDVQYVGIKFTLFQLDIKLFHHHY